ncbi:MAG: methyltransferase domain-containing protein [Planctomycetota bacterium]
MPQFRDPRLEQEFPDWGGLDPQTAEVVFDDLTTYLDRPIETIVHEYWQYRTGPDVIAQEQVGRATDEATVSAYYATTPHYLYELSYWEASRGKQAWFQVLWRAAQRYELQRALDFGGGVGGLSLYLWSHGIQSDHLDVPGKTFDYAAWRFARHNLKVSMHDATTPERWPHSAYDAVVAWDVLEHLFDLDAAIGRIARLLRTDGWLISKSTFAHSDGHEEGIHLAKHACHQDVRHFNQFLASHAFRYLGQLKPNRLSRLLRTCGLRHAVAGIMVVPRVKHGGNFLVHTRPT